MKLPLRIFVCVAVMAALSTASVGAEEFKAGDLVVTQAWSRATPSGLGDVTRWVNER
jgi:periplasmic copper chaperone A